MRLHRLARAGVCALALAVAPPLAVAAAAQTYPWQQLDAVGDETGFIRSLSVRVTIEDDLISATIDESHFDGTTISLRLWARLSDLNLYVAQARESARSIHPHVGVVSLRCRGGAPCVWYSSETDAFFELPGPRVFGFYVRDGAMAAQAMADLRRLADAAGR